VLKGIFISVFMLCIELICFVFLGSDELKDDFFLSLQLLELLFDIILYVLESLVFLFFFGESGFFS
jgi:hypothetical protein